MISVIHQLEFGASFGFGEAKVAQPKSNKLQFCHTLLHLTACCKDALDINHLKASFSFQIHGKSKKRRTRKKTKK